MRSGLLVLCSHSKGDEEMKPKKKELLPLSTSYRFGKTTQNGIYWWNQAISEYDEWLRSEECLKEVEHIIINNISFLAQPVGKPNLNATKTAKTILSALSGEGI